MFDFLHPTSNLSESGGMEKLKGCRCIWNVFVQMV